MTSQKHRKRHNPSITHFEQVVDVIGEGGWLDTDLYSTAWVAMVPSLDNRSRPAWPQALAYVRDSQLGDGSWGDPQIYYAHARVINTMAAIIALREWAFPGDDARIGRGLAALHRDLLQIPKEVHQPIGFELIFPSLLARLGDISQQFPPEVLNLIDQLHTQKMALINSLTPDPKKPHAWWFSMEMLPTSELATLQEQFLDDVGSVATSPAATAALLRARRLLGWDSPRAADYLQRLLDKGNGAVPFAWPVEVFEQLWMLDTYRRAGYGPDDKPEFRPLLDSLYKQWQAGQPGLSYSAMFPINDGDITAVGYTVLTWGGYDISDDALLALWGDDDDCSKTYPNELGASVSTNIHMLTALRSQPGMPRFQYIDKINRWLASQVKQETLFDDKWHLSPFYTVSHALSAFQGLNPALANECMTFILAHQQHDGGWSWFGPSTLEETAHCILALHEVHKLGLLKDPAYITCAAETFRELASQPVPRMWIGKALYHPTQIVNALVDATSHVLAEYGVHLTITRAS